MERFIIQVHQDLFSQILKKKMFKKSTSSSQKKRRKMFLCLKFVDNNPVIHFHYHDMLYTTHTYALTSSHKEHLEI